MIGKGILIVAIFFLTNNPAAAYLYFSTDVTSAYSNCRLSEYMDGTAVAEVDVSFKSTAGRLGDAKFNSRAFMFYAYSFLGTPIRYAPNSFSLGGVSGAGYTLENGYVMLHNHENVEPWNIQTPFTRTLRVEFEARILKGWPAISISAENNTSLGEITDLKSVYLSLGESRECTVVTSPLTPPSIDSVITVTAPDWYLGEIKTGEQIVPFSTISDQLCLAYNDASVIGKQFIINASSQNGTVNNQYQLKGQQDNTQIIPYQLTLDNGSNKIVLPNNSLSTLPLLENGKTCFLPTFRTFAPKGIKKGDYSDVLTFNIVTKA